MIERCFACSDLGFVVESNARRSCWRFAAGTPHNTPNDAARMLEKAVEYLMIRKIAVDSQAFEIAKMLVRHTTDNPFDKENLFEAHYTLPLRSYMGVIEDLRRIWLLPVGSRKSKPVGYWIITDIDDFKAWVASSKSAPITQLSTIAAVARRNFPIFAEQLELEFWQDMHGSDSIRQMSTGVI